MSAQDLTGPTRIVLSFSGAYANLALQLGDYLIAAKIDVRYDKWEGGGGAPALRSVNVGLDDAAFVLPLLTPSEAATTWIGDEWKQAVYDKARARNIDVLPVRGEICAIPDYLKNRSFADLRNRNYDLELRRLVKTIRDRSGDARIELPTLRSEVNAALSPMALPGTSIVLEVAKKFAPLFEGDGKTNPFFDEMIPMMRDGLFYELGVQFPKIRLRSGSDVPPSSVRILINDVPETEIEFHPDSVMVNDRVDTMAKLGFAAEPAVNPATDAEFSWIAAHQAAAAEEHGFTTWDTHGVLILSLSSVLRRKAADFIGTDEAQAMLKQIEPLFPQLIAETVPNTVSLFVLTDVLRRLVFEGVSIRNLRRILMALAGWGRVEKDSLWLTEYVRAALHRQIAYTLSRGTNQLVVILLHPDIETSIRESIRHTATGSYVDLKPDRLREILDAIREPLNALGDNVQIPQILTILEIRSSIRRLVAPSMPRLHVISYQELTPDTNIQPIGRISLDGFSPRAGIRF